MLDQKKLQNVFEMMMSDCIDAPLWPYHITKTNFFKKHGASAPKNTPPPKNHLTFSEYNTQSETWPKRHSSLWVLFGIFPYSLQEGDLALAFFEYAT